MQKFEFWWIDDEIDRLISAARRMIENPAGVGVKGARATLVLKPLKKEDDISKVVSELVQAKQAKSLPQLIIIDQILNLPSQGGILQRGSSLAVALRAQVPKIPIVGVSAVDLDSVAILQKNQFIDLISRDSINSGDRIPDFFAYAEGFRLVEKVLPKLQQPNNRVALLSLVKAPSSDKNLLFSCMPETFKGIWDEETPHAFARWIWKSLLERPGFLYDELESATLLGLKVSGFRKIESRFSKCRYAGVFKSSAKQRWWVSELSRTVRNASESKPPGSFIEMARSLLPHTDKNDLSKCHGSNVANCIPETVAFLDGLRDPSKRVQARMEDTVADEIDTPPPGFEQKRIFKRL